MAAMPRRGPEGRFVHHRRLFLITPTPDEQWPRPEGCAEMAGASRADGAPVFKIGATPAYSRARMEFAAAQLTHDPNEVQFFLQERPFCVEALLVFAEMLRGSGEHEAAFKLIRRAVYAVECGFEAGFSPFVQSGAGPSPSWPRVALQLPGNDDPQWPGWPWLAALSTYMLGLHAQGLSRTAIEVCKLLLGATLPRDPMHILVYLDVVCLRAHQYELLPRLTQALVGQVPLEDRGRFGGLDCMFPNFAYSAALARRRASGDSGDLVGLNLVSVGDVLPSETREAYYEEPEDPSVLPHAALMRAMLLFPQVLQPLLEAANVKLDYPAPAASPYRVPWREILAGPPFVRYNEFRHTRHFMAHALLSDAYGITCGQLWRGDATVAWLHACAVRLGQMHESSLFEGELTAVRKTWREAAFALDPALADYAGFSSQEVGPERRPPPIVQKAMEAFLHEAGAQAHAAFGRGIALGRVAVPAVAGAGDTGAAGAAGGEPREEEDEEQELARVLEASRREEEARQRRALVDEQDTELRASLAVDRARAAGEQEPAVAVAAAAPAAAVGASEEALVQLVAMGFETEVARRALTEAHDDVNAAVAILTS
mmetsp:Transcript_58662/g.148858  ORF Transcript_58662/g.148858 Transcript_58662/m.148858 type:complete len:599 (+) Transcript_58662:111-1907(+)